MPKRYNIILPLITGVPLLKLSTLAKVIDAEILF